MATPYIKNQDHFMTVCEMMKNTPNISGIPSYAQKDLCTRGNTSTRCYNYTNILNPSRFTYSQCLTGNRDPRPSGSYSQARGPIVGSNCSPKECPGGCPVENGHLACYP